MVCWAGFCLVFFSISKSKLPGYILPGMPATALLAARAISGPKWFTRRLARSSFLASGIIYFTAILYVRYGVHPNHALRNISWGLILDLLFVFGLYSFAAFSFGISYSFDYDSAANFSLRAAGAIVLAVLVASIPSGFEITEQAKFPGKWLADAVKSEAGKLRTFGVRRNDQYALNFYLHKEIQTWEAGPVSDAYVLAYSASCESLKLSSNCENLWGLTGVPGNWALLRITPKTSLGRPGGGRQPQQKE